MLDPNYIRDNQEKVKKGVRDRGLDPKRVDRWLSLDQKRRRLIQRIERLRKKRNLLADKVKKLGKKPPREEISLGKKIRKEIQGLEGREKEIKNQWREALYAIPNLPADDVPVGRDESENVEIEKWGEPTRFKFKPKDHLEIGERLDIIDVKRAAKVSGSRFGYFKGDGALLEFGLMSYVFQKLVDKGFRPIIPPVVTKKEVERGLGYAEEGGWDETYLFEKDGLVFVGSSEHSVIPMHKDEILENLPLRYVNFSACFRREAGSYGRDTRGLFRVHQFNKVEMNVYTVPDLEISDQECLNLLAIQTEIVRDLGLPYRVVAACTGDLPFPNRRMYDLEVWFPGQKRYRETHSCSNCTDYQTRRLNIRTKTDQGLAFVHALNATGITDRAVIAIIENYQQTDGSVRVPKVLRKFVGKGRIVPVG